MPFLVTRQQSDKSELYAVRESDGEILWDVRRREATQFAEDDADAVAAAINRYASTEALVVGCRV